MTDTGVEGILSPQTGVSVMAKYKRYSEDFKLRASKLVIEHGYNYRQAGEKLGVHG